MQLVWNKCEGNAWCPFLTVNLSHSHFVGMEGVYVIWHGGQQAWTVYVGQGKIADRIAAHRNEANILQYSPSGLFVTWAPVDKASRDGVERYLADQLHPKVGAAHPDAWPIQVNFPW